MIRLKCLFTAAISVSFCLTQPVYAGWFGDRCESFMRRHGLVEDARQTTFERLKTGAVIVHVTRLPDQDTMVTLLVNDYRYVGGRIYWRAQKIQKGYANQIDLGLQELERQVLTQQGMKFRMVLASPYENLTPSQREKIELALEDYGHLEIAPESAAQ